MYSLPVKIAAAILFVICVVITVSGTICCIHLANDGLFTSSSPDEAEWRIYSRYDNDAVRIVLQLYYKRYLVVAITLLGYLISLSSFIYLTFSAGHKKGFSDIVLSSVDKIPLDLLIGVGIAILCAAVALIQETYDMLYVLILIILLTIPCILIALSVYLSFIRRFKYGGWWKNTICCILLSFIWTVSKFLWSLAAQIFSNMAVLWKFIMTFAAYVILSAIFASIGNSFSLFLWILMSAALLVGVCILLVQFNILKKAAEMLSKGELNTKIETKNMFFDLRKHGENLNNISFGISKAVEERMKSERLKTELITNVSHDIKTPLTSIINYVDLIKREEIDNSAIGEYIEVLDKQSARLKKLIEDLIEASKASTGNITVNSVNTDLVELLNQSVGEYSERLRAVGIEPFVSVPDKPVMVNCDGRLMWRVFDNLLNNICKYSVPSTRAYLDIASASDMVQITFRNISLNQLNISGDELIERFVRGDASRSTEGSGLGLSIVKSLINLQGGTFDIYIDGDLFKAVIRFSI